MTSSRRSWMLRTFAAIATSSALLSPFTAHAQAPTTRILVGFPAGGGTDAIARILAELEGSGELDNTLIVFISDNGQFWGEHRFETPKNRY